MSDFFIILRNRLTFIGQIMKPHAQPTSPRFKSGAILIFMLLAFSTNYMAGKNSREYYFETKPYSNLGPITTNRGLFQFKNVERTYAISSPRALDCRTFTIGVTLAFAYIETTLTICCQGTPGHAGFYCFELRDKGSPNNQIVYDIPESWGKDLDSIEITKSSVEDFEGYNLRIKLGTYKVIKNQVFLEYELM